jgi:predicted RNase H-like HicB family nuclease
MHSLIQSLRPLPAYHVRLHWPEARPDGVEWWMATFDELPGCMVQGNSAGEAEARLWRVLPGYLRQLNRRGVPVPAPAVAPAASVEGISVVMAPSGVQAGQSDPGITSPLGGSGGLPTVAARADAALVGT